MVISVSAIVVMSASIGSVESVDLMRLEDTRRLTRTTFEQRLQPELAGDTIDAAITVFSSAGGAFLYGPVSHTIGGSDFVADPGPQSARLTSSVGTAGTTRTVTLTFREDLFSTALAPPGGTIGGAVVHALQFEFGNFNAGPDLFDDPQKIGAITGDFSLLDPSGLTVFSSGLNVNDLGTSFAVGAGVSAGAGNDIFDPTVVGFQINGGRVVFSYKIIPTPSGAAALLIAAGLTGVRRRRSTGA